MAVEACDKQKEMDDLDEDDAPIVFKRNSSSSKQNQSNSETKKPLPQKHDQQLGLNARPQNGQNNSVQKSKMGPSSRTPPDRSPLRSPKLSNSPTQGLAVKSTNVHSIPSTSMTGESKSVKRPIKAEKALNKSTSGPNEDSEDSEDDKPLSARFSKVNSGNAYKGANALNSGQNSKIPKSEDSDDKLPLSSKFQVKSTTSAEKKPLLAECGQNALNSGQNSKIPKSDDSDDKLPLSSKVQVKSTTSAEKKPLLAECGQNALNSSQNLKIPKSEDLDDKLPLSSKFRVKSTTSAEKKPLLAECGQNALNSGQNSKISKSEDSDDELPLSAKFRVKSTTSAEKKPLLAECGQNGSTSGERKPLTVLKKRNVDDVKPTDGSSLKRPKLSGMSLHKNKESSTKAEIKEEDDEDHVPISQRIKKTSLPEKKSAVVKKMTKPTPVITKKFNKKPEKVIKNSKYSESSKVPPSSGEGQKWTTLVHNGVIFPPPYKPHGVKILYKGKPVALTPEQEEVATMFAVMLDTEYMDKPKFKENFMDDWRKILGKNHSIQSLEHCDFTPIYEWHQKEKEKKKQLTTEEKKALKEEKLKQEEKYMWAVLDGVKEKVGNFRVEPPGLFRGRGEHPKMGKLKKRIRPSDITINIGRDAPIPECPIAGESWKEIRHDNTVTWLAYWNDPINPKEFKYVFLAASSSLKGQSDKEKYEKARLLKDYIQGIRKAYTKDFASSDPTKKQIAVATYLIDKLALRAGNEKDDDEADTVGCCTLKVENVEPVPPNILKFDFLGKDSIRYQNEVEVEVAVFRAIQQFRTGKKGGDDMFDRLDTSKLNAHLKELMPGLTAKVFRTYNASITLDDMLNRETKGGEVTEKIVVYQHANKEVAIICNHQRTVSKSHSAQMTRLDEKIDELKSVLDELRTDLARAKKGKPPLKSSDGKVKRNLNPESLEKKISQTTAKIEKMVRDKETKEDLKTVALGTSKINYLDPRITVAWCKRHEVPIEKIFNKSLLAKFAWSMDVDPSFRF